MPVDLTAIIFVVIAVAWAAYLIPMALKHHEGTATRRPIEEFSDAVRVLGRTGAAPAPAAAPASRAQVAAKPKPTGTTKEAAKRRRRVLTVLLLALAGTVAASSLGYSPWWSTAAPTILIVAFLVIARLTVRAQQVRRAAPVQQEVVAPTAPAEVEPDLHVEDTIGVSRADLAAAVGDPVLDEGALWDPLPVTLPTYVNKARARRTVRTIEITGMTSSGHDADDSALAREAEVVETEVAEAEGDEARRAAGA
jgi:hypothetical protein